MTEVPYWRLLLRGAAVAAVAAVLILPPTRDVVRRLLNGPIHISPLNARDIPAFARRHKAEPGPRIAAATALVPGGADSEDDSRETWRRLAAAMEDLVAELPASAAVRAAAIRAYCGPSSGRSVLDVSTGASSEPGAPSPRDVASVRAVADRVLVHAKEGERADPANAFFPAMRSLALFAQGESASALRALHDAAARTEWCDYVAEEVRGWWCMRADLTGRPGAWARAADLTGARLAHHRHLRALSHLAADHAMRREMSGDAAAGAAIRSDMLRLGGLVRTESSTVVGTLTGMAMARGALARPGGAPALRSPDGQRWDRGRWDREIVDRYVRYLEQHNLRDHVEEVRAEAATWPEVRRVTGDADWLMPRIWAVTLWWSLAVYVLLASLWFAGLRVGAGFAARRGVLARGARLALVVHVILGIALLLPAAAGLVLAVLRHPLEEIGADRGGTASSMSVAFAGLVCVVAAALVWFTLVAAVRAMRRRTSGQGATEWYRHAAGPVAMAHMVLWALAIGLMARAEQSASNALSQAVTHEGRYVAGLRHQPWPGTPGQSNRTPGP